MNRPLQNLNHLGYFSFITSMVQILDISLIEKLFIK